MTQIEVINEHCRTDKKYGKNPRNALLFSFGINSGLRIADILSLYVKDVKDKDYIELREKKTNKYKKFPINENLKAEIEELKRQTLRHPAILYPKTLSTG